MPMPTNYLAYRLTHENGDYGFSQISLSPTFEAMPYEPVYFTNDPSIWIEGQDQTHYEYVNLSLNGNFSQSIVMGSNFHPYGMSLSEGLNIFDVNAMSVVYDSVNGGPGWDSVNAGPGWDSVNAGPGWDSVGGSPTGDSVSGGYGTEIYSGAHGSIVLDTHAPTVQITNVMIDSMKGYGYASGTFTGLTDRYLLPPSANSNYYTGAVSSNTGSYENDNDEIALFAEGSSTPLNYSTEITYSSDYLSDSGAWTASFTLPAGTTSLYATAKDIAGNVSGNNETYTLDTTPPVLEPHVWDGDSGPMYFDMPLTDPMGNPLYFTNQKSVVIDDGGMYNPNPTNDTFDVSWTNLFDYSSDHRSTYMGQWYFGGVPVQEGLNFFEIHAHDLARNSSQAQVSVIRDTVAPTVEIMNVTIDPNGGYATVSGTFTNLTDPMFAHVIPSMGMSIDGGEMYSMDPYINNNDKIALFANGSNTPLNSSISISYMNGTWSTQVQLDPNMTTNLVAQGTDIAGNIGNNSATYTISAESKAPASFGGMIGDSNGDGTQDSAQENVTSTQAESDGAWFTIAADSINSPMVSVQNVVLTSIPTMGLQSLPNGYGFASKNSVSFTLNNLDLGATVPVSLFFDDPAGRINGYAKLINGNWEFVKTDVIHDQISGRTRLDFSLTDGGLFDEDGKVNGSILDPLIPAEISPILGTDGNDTLIGGTADDILIGGIGKDVLTGGSGSDLFVYNNTNQSTLKLADTIKDFTHGVDDMDFSAIAGIKYVQGLLKTTIIKVEANSVAWTADRSGNTQIYVNTGDTTAVFQPYAQMKLILTGQPALDAGDFILSSPVPA